MEKRVRYQIKRNKRALIRMSLSKTSNGGGPPEPLSFFNLTLSKREIISVGTFARGHFARPPRANRGSVNAGSFWKGSVIERFPLLFLLSMLLGLLSHIKRGFSMDLWWVKMYIRLSDGH